MPELTLPNASSSGDASAASTIRASRPSPSRTIRPYAPASAGSKERTVAAARAARCVSTSARIVSGLSAGTSPLSTSTSPPKPSSALRAQRTASPVPRGSSPPTPGGRFARAADGVPGAARLLLHGDLDSLEKVARLRRGDDDEPLDAGSARGVDYPVDHPPAEDRVQVLRRRPLHARADSGGHHDCCELVCHVREKWLGRQDSNLGSRDQNPLPYHLATPQGHGSLPAVEPEECERDDGARDEAEDQQPLEEDREQDEHDGDQLRDDEDPQGLPNAVRAAVPAEPPGDP